ncbi:hypothetical protein FRC06_006501 [Ceratobasidium sp. 370]|nr:hypothetical protein FRC06_006501 [Ceratobasidium sp. 370]
MLLTILQAYLRAPHITMCAFHSSTVLPITPASMTTVWAASPIRTDLDSGERAENIEVCKEPRLALPLSSETVSITKEMGHAMGDTSWYGLTGMTYAQSNAHDKSLWIPGRVLPPPATLFSIQNVPGANGLERFAKICAPPRADAAAAMSHTGTSPS